MRPGDGGRSRAVIALVAAAMGFFGEVTSPFFFTQVFSVDLVLVLQIMFIGLIMLGFYVMLGVMWLDTEETQSALAAIPEDKSTESPGADAGAVKTRSGINLTDRGFDRVVIVVTILAGLSWWWADYASTQLAFEYPDLIVSYALDLLTTVSFVAGSFLACVTAFLRMGRDSHHHTMVKASLVILISTGVVWFVAERTAYAMILEYLLHLELSEYIALARLSSAILLVSVLIFSLSIALIIYVGKVRIRQLSDDNDC